MVSKITDRTRGMLKDSASKLVKGSWTYLAALEGELALALDVVEAADKVGVTEGENVYANLFTALAAFKAGGE